MAKAKYLKKKRPPRPPKNYAMTILENLKIGKSYFLKKNNAPNQNTEENGPPPQTPQKTELID